MAKNNPRTLTHEKASAYFAEKGCELLTRFDDLNVKSKIQYKCECGRIAWITLDSFRRGCRCNACGREKMAKAQRYDPAWVKQYYKDHGCELLEEYTWSGKSMKYRCRCGCIHKKPFISFLQKKTQCKKFQ